MRPLAVQTSFKRRTISRHVGAVAWPPRIPLTAHFLERGRNSYCIWGELLYCETKAQICWNLDGDILSECYFDRQGLRHGVELSRFKSGAVEWQQTWRHGQMDGFARQFDDQGRSLYRARFVAGTGLDLWVQYGVVVESRELRKSVRHGFERWGHPRLPYEERHFLLGRQTGIARRWIGAELEDGFPKYFLEDEEISRKRYLRVCEKMRGLPPACSKDDKRERPLLPQFRKIWLRKDVRERLEKMPDYDESFCCNASL